MSSLSDFASNYKAPTKPAVQPVGKFSIPGATQSTTPLVAPAKAPVARSSSANIETSAGKPNINPFSAASSTAKFTLGAVQGINRSLKSVTQSAVSPFKENSESEADQPKTKVGQFLNNLLYGKEPVKDVARRVNEAQGAVDPTGKHTKLSLIPAIGAVFSEDLMNLLNPESKSGEKKLAELALEKNPAAVTKLLSKLGLAEEEVTRLTPLIAKADKPGTVKAILDTAKSAEELMKVPQALRSAKGMTAEDIMKTHPDIKLVRDVPATDIHGNKVKIPNGEVLTPYEMKGNKVLLQDGQTYVVSKSQFQNIKGNAISKEAKEFAPELKGTEETIRGGNNLKDRIDSLLNDEAGQGMTRAQAREHILTDAEDEVATKYHDYQLPEGKNYKEILIKAPEVRPLKNSPLQKEFDKIADEVQAYIDRGDERLIPAELLQKQNSAKYKGLSYYEPSFKSSHWDEPNVISHVRMNERTYNGKKVAFMEELQSDWAREARAGKTEATNPLLKNWQETSVKRALKDAVDSDAEYFSWINGEQTSARYNLATHIEDASWNTYKAGEKTIQLNTKGSGAAFRFDIDETGEITNAMSGTPDDWVGKKLDEVLGKGLADKIMSAEKGTLSGEGLKFGGEWANNLYDKQVGNIVKDLTGAKVETLDLNLPIDAKGTVFMNTVPKGTSGWEATGELTSDNIKVGNKILKEGTTEQYVITDILEDGKFKAVPKEISTRAVGMEAEGAEGVEGMVDFNKFSKPQQERIAGQLSETFDISTKKTTQQGIRLTPEIKAKIRGEAPEFSASGKGLPNRTEPKSSALDRMSQRTTEQGALKPGEKQLAGEQSPQQSSQGSSGNRSGSGDSKVFPYDDKVNLDLNTEHYNISQEGKQVIQQTIEEVKPQIEKAVGKRLSNQEALDLTQKTSEVFSKAVTREETLAWQTRMLRTRQAIADAAEKGDVKNVLDNLLATKTMGTDVARKLQSLSISADPREVTAMETVLKAVLDVTDNADEILKAAEGVDFNDAQQAAEFYRKFIAPTKEEWLNLVRYNSMLSSPNTHIINFFSNLPNTAIVAPVTKLVAGGFDFLSSAVTGSERKMFAGEAPAYLKGYFSDVKSATDRFFKVMSGEKGITQLDLRNVPLSTKGTSGKIAKTLSFPMRVLEATDQFFSALTESGIKASLEYRKAQGVNVGNIASRAAEEASYWLYRTKPGQKEGQGVVLDGIDWLTNVLASARNSNIPIIKYPAEFTFPFVQTPTNIFKQGLEYTPMGLVNLYGAANKTEQLAKVAIGTAFGATAGIMIASNRMTFDEPVNATEKNAFRAAGMIPYSIKIGDRWYSYQKLPPAIAYPLAAIAAIHWAGQNRKIDESWTEGAMKGVAKYTQFLGDQSYMKSVGDLISAVSGGQSGVAKLLGNYPQQLIPFRALSGWFARLADEYQRQITPDANFVEKQVDYLMMNIPFLSRNLEPRVDSKGNPIPQPDRLINAFSPVKTSLGNETLEKFLINHQALMKAEGDLKIVNQQEKAKVQPVYDEAQKLKAQGDFAGAQSLVNQLTDAEYKIYQQIKSGADKSSSQEVKDQVFPLFLEAQDLKNQGKAEEAQKIVDGLTDEQYKAYESLKNLSKVTDPSVDKTQFESKQGLVGSVVTYAKAIGVDPVTAFNRIFTGQKIKAVRNGTVIVERMSLSDSEKVKKERGAISTMRLDHTLPLELGGSNSESNLKLVSEEEWKSYTPIENALGKALIAKVLDKKTAQNLIIKFKNGEISAEDVLNLIK